MHLLLASILPLVLGPVLVWVLQRARWAARALDSFVLVSVAGVVLLSVFPEALANAGIGAVVAIVVGTTLPLIGGKVFSAKPGAVRTATMLTGLLGLALHATLDGVALAAPDHGHGHGPGSTLAWAVLLHRFPEGLAIWWLVRPRLGVRIALATVAAIIGASTLGFFFAHEAHASMHGPALGAFQALMAGSLLHAAVGHSVAPEEPGQDGRWHIASTVGGLLGAAIVHALAQSHPLPRVSPSELAFSETFWVLARQSAPALLIAFFAASIAHLVLAGRFGSWLRGSSSFSQTFRGVSTGQTTSTCACDNNPRYRKFVEGGIPRSAAIAFLISTPELSIVSVAVSFPLLGGQLAVARLTAASLIAAVGLLLGRSLSDVSGTSIPPAFVMEAVNPWARRFRRAALYGFADVADRTLPWYLAGLLAAALVEPMLRPVYVTQVPSWLEVPLFAALGTPLYVCAAGATPLAAVMVHKGLSAGAAVAFLLTGPATSLTTLGLLSQLHGRKVAVLFGVVLIATAVVIGWFVNVLLASTTIDLHDIKPTEPLSSVCLISIGLLVLASLLRQGAHGFVSRVVQLHRHHHVHASDATTTERFQASTEARNA